ncbi:MAG: glycine reductase, partial [Chloroflexi bacterium]|nr:glycine reductase [Chloroflexota bacterium]
MPNQDLQRFPVVTGASYFLAHLPGRVRYGSKPTRELDKTPDLQPDILSSLRNYEDARAYPPHQVFIGNLRPDALWDIPRPWYRQPVAGASRFGPYGEIMPEHEFLALLKLCDNFNLVLLEEGFVEQARKALAPHPLIRPADLERIGHGVPMERVEAATHEPDSAPLFVDRDRLVGCVLRGHEEDPTLTGHILMENLACVASGMMALRHALALEGAPAPDQVDYVLGNGEEASGDRYQRGAGSLAKAMAEHAGCTNATGGDLKAYCCSPIHTLALAGSTIQS